MAQNKVKFATQVSADVLNELRDLARSEGRQVQALVDEALTDVIAKHKNTRPRPHVLAAYRTSLKPFGPLYKKLAE
jgi:hypothetical protein